MPTESRPRRQPTDDLNQLCLLVATEADGRCLHEVGEPRFFTTGRASPQPFLAPLDDVAWHPARRLAPYRARRKRPVAGQQARLFGVEEAVG